MNRLQLQLDEERLRADKADASERHCRTRMDALLKRTERLEKEERDARDRVEALERELLLVKQHVDKSAREAERSLTEAAEAHAAEINAMQQSLSDAESKLDAVRGLERAKAARIEELEAQLQISANRIDSIASSSRKRPKHSEEDVAALQHHIRDLEAQNQALEHGVVASQRMQEFSAQVHIYSKRALDMRRKQVLTHTPSKYYYSALLASGRFDGSKQSWRKRIKQDWRLRKSIIHLMKFGCVMTQRKSKLRGWQTARPNETPCWKNVANGAKLWDALLHRVRRASLASCSAQQPCPRFVCFSF